jgi:hypothetical protein
VSDGWDLGIILSQRYWVHLQRRIEDVFKRELGTSHPRVDTGFFLHGMVVSDIQFNVKNLVGFEMRWPQWVHVRSITHWIKKPSQDCAIAWQGVEPRSFTFRAILAFGAHVIPPCHQGVDNLQGSVDIGFEGVSGR